ncbi:hypothetical protein QBC47DRAFT_391504 [Echria macrotheca]|uniref:DUF6594 domain-containing protein n=1 Tax=Echria macrotheca TaxID=438768 RepID=A0AAJ0B3Y6_9PEZI|nr:hypothetical protein QBC47DRAFT_391504 [Echria macrotheca]
MWTDEPAERFPTEYVDGGEVVDGDDISLHEYRPDGPSEHTSRPTSRPRPSGSPPRPSRRPSPRNAHIRRGPRRPARASELVQLDFPHRLAAAGNIHLFVRDLDRNRDVKGYSIYLATLQRMVLCDLRRQLAEVVAQLEGGRRASRVLREDAMKLLAEYCNAVRDYDFIAERLAKAREEGEDDPFQISSNHLLDLCLMRDAGLLPVKGKDDLSWDDLYHRVKVDRDRYHDLQNVLPSQSRSRRHDAILANLYLDRLVMGLAGGTALIAPMLIMVLHKDLVTTLVTTTAATMLFAGALALLGTKLKGETVLASVAAYAAVLVVFVGTNGSG